MRGCLQKAKTKPRLGAPKGEFTWRIILSLGRASDGKHKQKWVTFRGTRKQAEKKLTELTGQVDRGEFVEPSKRTLGEWLQEWLVKMKTKHYLRTYEVYRNVVQRHMLKSDIATIRLQQLTASDVEHYHRTKSALSNATLQLHHTVLTAALKIAKRDKLVRDNAAVEATERPRKPEEKSLNVWDIEEARKVLVAAKLCSTQTGAFLALALDSGARKAELLGLRWTDIDLTTGALRIERQLIKCTPKADFGPTKTRRVRTLDLSEQTITLLREHKREQSELKLANRPQYDDNGLVFAQTWEHRGFARCTTACGNNCKDARSFDSQYKRASDHGARSAPYKRDVDTRSWCSAARSAEAARS